MDDEDPREQILRLEVQIEELAEAVERCRKTIQISKVAIALGGILMVAITLGAVRFDPAVMIGAIAAIIGGTVVFGSNTSTSKQTTAAMKAAEARRAELISRIDLSEIGGREVEC